jgi:internalin A
MNMQTGPIRFAGRQFPTDTEVIDLVNAQLATLEPLGDLPELRELRLHHTDPHRSPGGPPLDLSVLHGCPHLAAVEIPRHNVRSLQGLEDHRALHTVDVSSTRVQDLRPLAGLPSLSILRLRHTRVDSLEPLATILTLAELDVAHTAVADISALSELPALASLDLRATSVTDLAVVAHMPALRRVVAQRLDVDPAVIDGLRVARPDVEVIADSLP